MRLMATLLLLCACAEAKKQVRLGVGGSGAYAPGQSGNVGSNDPIGAIGAAVGAAAASRATGGCIASCPPGTKCNEQTGLCDTMPCRDQCKADELCQNERCVPMLLPGLKIQK
ncbi:MAG: hypothetical protein JNK82_40155 [Myxococcaceae bacterium]|nr:hypothetical protein [Myxococcaceae bacterium]